jgi:hypothetical protein
VSRCLEVPGLADWLMIVAKDNLGLTALEGNRIRALWKNSCRAIAKNVRALSLP